MGIWNAALQHFRCAWRNLFARNFVITCTVKTLISHTAVRLALLVVMCASSIGFTTILPYCTMSHSSECCCTTGQNGTASGRSESPSIAFLNVFCNTQIVAGGVNPVALNVGADASVKSFTSDLIPVDSGIILLSFVSHTRILAHANDMAPPIGDITLRNCSLLI